MSKANRKTNRSKRISHRCRNNGSCSWCSRSRTHQSRKEEFYTKKQIEETINPIPYADSPEFDHNTSEALHNAYNEMYLETIDEKIDKWHNSDSKLELWEYLGWTKEEYKEFVETGKIPKRNKK